MKLNEITVAAAAAISTVNALYIPEYDVQQTVFETQDIEPVNESTDLDPSVVESLITAEGLEARANDLYAIAKQSIEERGNPTRVIGSQGHQSTLDYILGSLESFGSYYHVWCQKFNAVAGKVNKFELELLGDEYKKVKSAVAFSLTPPTPGHEPVTGKLNVVNGSGCSESDYANVPGQSIVVVQRGECPFGQKSELAGKAGAIACIIYNNEGHNESIAGTLGTPSDYHVPTLGVSKDDGKRFVASSENGKEAKILVDSTVEIIETSNVIAETVKGDHDNVVMLGAHSDSVGEGPGINDDGSGTISLLEVAEVLTQFNTTNAVRFAWWSAEEEGLVGSDYYAENLSPEENNKIRMFMDYDMMASPNYAYQIYDANNEDNPVGSEELKQKYVDFYSAVGVNYSFVPFDGRSDYDGFIRHGIPGGGVATGAEGIKTDLDVQLFGGTKGIQYDPCYHEACDGLDNVDYEAWVINTKLIAHCVASYGKSLKGFPKRQPVDQVNVARVNPYKHHGRYLVL